MGLRISELSQSQVAELEKNPYKGPDYKPFGIEILKNIELSREEMTSFFAFKPDLTRPQPKHLPQ